MTSWRRPWPPRREQAPRPGANCQEDHQAGATDYPRKEAVIPHRIRRALITGTIVSLAVTAVWAWASALTIGPAGPMHLTWRHPVASYVTLAAAPTGNAWELLAVVAVIFAACLLVFGRRRGGGS